MCFPYLVNPGEFQTDPLPKELLATNRAKGREPLARLIASLPQVTYNMAMGVLKVAPRGKPGGSDAALYAEGQMEAKRLLGLGSRDSLAYRS